MVRVLRLVLLALLLVVLGACGSGGSSGYSDVLIVVTNDGLAELSLEHFDEQLIISNPADKDAVLVEPAISPDRATLAYVRELTPIVIPGEQVELGMDIYLANPDGSDQRLLLEHSEPNEQVRAPTWFPDGQRLLINVQYFVDAQIMTDLEILHIATGERTVIIENGFRPALSADGTKITYVTQEVAPPNVYQYLWVANADGSDPRQLAGPDDQLGSIISPRFSPDGASIVFAGSNLPAATSMRDADAVYVTRDAVRAASSAASYNGLPADIWTIPVDGGEPRKLAPLQLDLPGLDWSADGQRLFVYAGLGLYVVDPATGSHERLGDGTFHGQITWVSAEEPAGE
jgi:Tol biopolymer transport system component